MKIEGADRVKITHLKINHLKNPLGYDLAYPTVSYVVEEAPGTRQVSARVQVAEDEAFRHLAYDSGERDDINSCGFEIPVTLRARRRYYWKVAVTDDTSAKAVSKVQWFETARVVTGPDLEWSGRWITPDAAKEIQMVLFYDFHVLKPVRRARAYVTGLGLYELYLDSQKLGDEYMLPGFCDYDSWIQYQTFELDLRVGIRRFEIVLGDGWYKGWYGLRKFCENYGDRLAALAEIRIEYEDGTEDIIGTDESWKARRSRIVYSGIYPGEVYDASLDVSEIYSVKTIDLGYERLHPRLSLPVKVHERIHPAAAIHSPRGETILDMGQNLSGWISFKCSAAEGTKIHLQTGEILQDGCFYNDNLRTAKSEFTYISDGKERWVRQHFTFFGFRYVKVEGWEGIPDPADFEALALYSDMEELGDIETSDPLVNQLVKNARWGMKGNFLDIPTDCPQRDERYGWTGDAQIFSGTASFFMDTCAFYTKYARDIACEQEKLGGSVPDTVPTANNPGDASAAWGDAAVIIPWTVYLHFGDKGILRRQYLSMKGWVDYIYREDEKDGGQRLWLQGSHYGDWLALDGYVPGGVYGRTDPGLIASAYYYYSARIVSKTAKILGYGEDSSFYHMLAQEIKAAYAREYFTPAGNIAVDTTTACVISLFMDLVPESAKDRVRKKLFNHLKKNHYHLDTGFVGTPYLCRVLSENGMNGLAYHLLLEKGYPGWLYEVLMGATTVWERWDSVKPDGKISGTEMNSLNHYSYGSIVEWMFREMAGIQPKEDSPGFKHFRIAPKPDWQIRSAKGKLCSAAGEIVSSWEIRNGKLHFAFCVPFDSRAEIILPDADVRTLVESYPEFADRLCQEQGNVMFEACAGDYTFSYEPTIPYRHIYSLETPWKELCDNPATREILNREYPYSIIPFESELCTLEEMTRGPFTCISQELKERIDSLLREAE